MLDNLIKAIALAAFVASLAILVIWEPAWDLVAVMVIVVALAAYDFFVRPYRARGRRS
ncbi:MAG: hypothetical protein WD036_06130 [Bauldia sp.]